MPLHYSKDGYAFRADALPLAETAEHPEPAIDAISALSEALKRCRGPEEAWMAMNLRRAMVLVGELDEKVAREILDQEGV